MIQIFHAYNINKCVVTYIYRGSDGKIIGPRPQRGHKGERVSFCDNHLSDYNREKMIEKIMYNTITIQKIALSSQVVLTVR